MLAACRKLSLQYNLCAVTNDIFTREDAEFLVKNNALSEDRIMAVETGGCPHAAIRVRVTILRQAQCYLLIFQHVAFSMKNY